MTLERGRQVSDRSILYCAAFSRAFATGMAGVLFGIYLAALGFDPARIGVVIAAGLTGAAAAALVVTLIGDRLGRRATLIALSLLAGAGGAIVAVASGPTVVAVAAFVGMLNGMGRDRSASLIVDQALLPGMVADAERTKAFAWYSVCQDAGHALGALLAGVPALLQAVFALDVVTALKATMGIYAGLQLVIAFGYLGLSDAVERSHLESGRARVSPQTRRTLWKVSSLFAVDSLAGGFLTTALLAFFFYERFGVSELVVGLLFFGARIANAASHLGAAGLARRIGLVNTMVFTHVPSSLLLFAVPFAPTFPVAAALFLLREGLVEMDVPTRQSYVMAFVEPAERAFVSGVTHLVRLACWAAAPAFAGVLMGGLSLAAPVYVGAAMKITYDVLLYRAFRTVKPPEER